MSLANSTVERLVKKFYRTWIRSRIKNQLYLQRIKLIWFLWEYSLILRIQSVTLLNRIKIITGFLKVDWNVMHAHRPCEIAEITKALAQRSSRRAEVFVEAGCWKGGSSAKFSLICKMFGYDLHIYDSFEGVETLSAKEQEDGYDYSGEYIANEGDVLDNIKKFGAPDICQTHKGWFSETIASHSIGKPIRLVYIDCDLAKGTREVLQGVVPNLVEDGLIFTQDYHIKPVRKMLQDPATWESLKAGFPKIEQKCGNLALIQFTKDE